MNEQNTIPIKKENLLFKILRWIVYLIFIVILGILIFRIFSSGIPRELRNYLIRTPEIDELYMKLKDDFKIYELDAQAYANAEDGVFSVEKVYYLEDAEILQVMIKGKNSEVQPLILNSESPFIAFSVVSTKNNDDDWFGEGTAEKMTGWDTVSSNEKIFGKSTDKFQYFIYSFDGVKIDYDNSIASLDIFLNDNKEYWETASNPDNRLRYFTVYWASPKKIIPAKKFKLG